MSDRDFKLMLVMVMVLNFGGALIGMGVLYDSTRGAHIGIGFLVAGAFSLALFALVKACQIKK